MSKHEQMEALLRDALRETGHTITVSTAELAAYTLQTATKLTAAIGQPGFDEAVRAARDAVAMFAGLSAAREADRADQRLFGILTGALVTAISAV